MRAISYEQWRGLTTPIWVRNHCEFGDCRKRATTAVYEADGLPADLLCDAHAAIILLGIPHDPKQRVKPKNAPL